MGEKLGKALVVGAGIAGIRSALDFAETGHEVTLIDAAGHMGGILSKLDYQFPTDRCGMCRMLPLVQRDLSSQWCLRKGLFHESVSIMLSSRLDALEGDPGNYTATIKQKKQYIDPDLCNGCGRCSEVCPVEISDQFNEAMGVVKAVYLPLPHAVPNHYVIDEDACTRCGECVKACPTGAVTLPRDKKKDFKILVVDDELIVRDSLKEWFEFEGYTVEMASSGKQAIEILEESTSSNNGFNLMLLDIKMPEMDGTEVLKETSRKFPDLQVVMMTAYATVESAVETLKQGALEYVIKPFDPDSLIPIVERLYKAGEKDDDTRIEIHVNAVVLSCGTSFYNPAQGKNTLGYKEIPDVVTNLEFERILSGTGPFGGILQRPSDGRVPERIAWVQCVGSRTSQDHNEYCSSVCCMVALKEAVLAKKRSAGRIETVIYYMDMRCFNKEFEAYRKEAETRYNVVLKRARPHSVRHDPETGRIMVYIVDDSGDRVDEAFDMLVLSVGQKPALETRQLAEVTGIELDDSGFPLTDLINGNENQGVFPGGSFAGLNDISESIILSASASLNASTIICKSLGNPPAVPEDPDQEEVQPYRDVSRENPVIALVVCRCPQTIDTGKEERISAVGLNDPQVSEVIVIDAVCTKKGWSSLIENLEGKEVNRILLMACLPYRFRSKLRELSGLTCLDPCYMDVQDITNVQVESVETITKMAIARIRHADVSHNRPETIVQKVLVAGAGPAGMTAALSVAENGYDVILVEKSDALGGNLKWLAKGLGTRNFRDKAEQLIGKIENHPHIQLFTGTTIIHSTEKGGSFSTILETADNSTAIVEHGAVILAVGGKEASTTAYEYNNSPWVITLKELEEDLEKGDDDTAKLDCVVMIQCVDSRDETKEYCSRICCKSTLKHALALKKNRPDINIFVLYRDMMSYGASEIYYREARDMGIIFIRYTKDRKPEVVPDEHGAVVKVFEPVIGKEVEIQADRVVLATGIRPNNLEPLADIFRVELDRYMFIKPADSKWRPVDCMKAGVFACGMALGPRDVEESLATARAAAMGALKFINKKMREPAAVTAAVKTSLCSVCERCIDACPYGARTLNQEGNAIEVNLSKCQGCGTCATVCVNSASFVNQYSDQQFLEMIDAACR